ncbi:MAG: hypothetical protein ACKOEQ_03145 [Verrucomicrobiota bacterium]
MNDDYGPDPTPVSNPLLREVRLQLLLAAGLVTLFIARQAWIQHQAVAVSRPNVERLRAELAKMNAIRESFARYGSDHHRFVPILNKYGIAVPGAAAPNIPNR